MSNTFTDLAPVAYGVAREVPTELTGVIAAVARDFNDQNAAKGDAVKVAVAPIAAATDVSPAMTWTAGTDRIATTKSFTLDYYKGVSLNMTAEQDRSLQNAGDVAKDMFAQSLRQAQRALINTIESYVFGVARLGTSRAIGTPATAPFASDLTLLTAAMKILKDNGAAGGDVSAILDTTAEMKLLNLSQLQKANEAGGADILNAGVLGRKFGAAIRTSAQIGTTAIGTGANYLCDSPAAATYAIGTTAIHIDTGTGTVLAGDVVTFTGDTNKYVVAVGCPGDSDQDIVLAEPGLRQTLANNVAMTVGALATSNLVIQRNATKLVVRPALQPAGAGIEQMTVTDPATGFSFLLLRVVGDSMASWYIRSVYGAFSPNPYGGVQLLG